MYRVTRSGVPKNMPESRITAVYQYRDPNVNDAYYSSDEFRMFGFKIVPCPRTQIHDWTDCPLAHQGEKAQRRDPSIFNYMAIACPNYKANNGECPVGDSCCFAHGLFEYWLHPAKYRTRPCHMGRFCRRKVCFFAHGPEQLRTEIKYKVHWSNRSFEGVTQIIDSANQFGLTGSERPESTSQLGQRLINMEPVNMMISSIIDDEEEEIGRRLSELSLKDGNGAHSGSGFAYELKSGMVDQALPNLPEIEW